MAEASSSDGDARQHANSMERRDVYARIWLMEHCEKCGDSDAWLQRITMYGMQEAE